MTFCGALSFSFPGKGLKVNPGSIERHGTFRANDFDSG